uniref:E3 ubiquitin-protein ligase BRE1-like 1 isoform X1 n=1 Tax=Rhizophora mucronata TaxID=61149 RepID=A0A2P2J7N6_RHIMU
MGSEPDRKRRHFSSISPKPVMAKKQPFAQLSEGKKVLLLGYSNYRTLILFCLTQFLF